jgi:hypothetical protein
METANILKQVIGIISKACTKNKVGLVCTGHANSTARGIIPRPIGGIYLKHVLNVIVHFVLRRTFTRIGYANIS